MRYTINDLRKQFPDDDSCLLILFNNRYANLNACPKCGTVNARFYRVKNRKCFVCKECRHQLYPLKGTIFEKTTTPLTYWFHAIYLFSVSKNGVSAKELERQIGVSYKTAHRMAKQIRLLMQEKDMIGGLGTPIEIDEAYIGGKKNQGSYERKTAVIAALEVKGHVRTAVIPRANTKYTTPFIEDTVFYGSMLHTDESKLYKSLRVKQYYKHESVKHIAKEFVRNGVTTNHVEGFFGQLKRSLDGTFHAVSPYYLHSYVNEFAFRYNYRNSKTHIFSLLLERITKTVSN